jgi:hypothetical protein
MRRICCAAGSGTGPLEPPRLQLLSTREESRPTSSNAAAGHKGVAFTDLEDGDGKHHIDLLLIRLDDQSGCSTLDVQRTCMAS